MGELLAKELQTFNTHKSELTGKTNGKFALVKDDRIVYIFDTKFDAIRQGYER